MVEMIAEVVQMMLPKGYLLGIWAPKVSTILYTITWTPWVGGDKDDQLQL